MTIKNSNPFTYRFVNDRPNVLLEPIERILPAEKSILPHRTWINGKPADLDRDQLQPLQVIAGEASVTPGA